MSSYVMAPPAETYVRRSGGEVRLKVQRGPASYRVPGEADGVPVRAGAGIAREDERPAPPEGGVEKVPVVEQPERVKALDRRARTLLPVYPPEVHAHVLQRM